MLALHRALLHGRLASPPAASWLPSLLRALSSSSSSGGGGDEWGFSWSTPAVGFPARLPRPFPRSCRPCGPWTTRRRSSAPSSATTARGRGSWTRGATGCGRFALCCGWCGSPSRTRRSRRCTGCTRRTRRRARWRGSPRTSASCGSACTPSCGSRRCRRRSGSMASRSTTPSRSCSTAAQNFSIPLIGSFMWHLYHISRTSKLCLRDGMAPQEILMRFSMKFP